MPRAVGYAALLGRAAPTPPDVAAVAHRNARADAVLQAAVLRHDARLAEPAADLCPQACLLERDGVLLYRDDDHLSAQGSLWLMPKLLETAD